MHVLITYDVSTTSTAGRRRLRRIARTCLDFGQRVQNSVFECEIQPADLAVLKSRLVHIMEPKEDSLRIYNLGKNWRRRVEHFGTKEPYDVEGPLVV